MSHENLSGVISRFEDLPWSAKASLYEGEPRFLSDTPMVDYSPTLSSFTKAVEICLLKVVFDRFKSVCNAKLNVSQHIEISMQNEKSQAMSLFAYLGRGQHLELGSMAHILRLCNGRTAQKELLIGTLRNFITRDLGGVTLLDKDNVDCIALISKDFRNPAIHSDVISQAQVEECRQLCINVLQSLEPCVASYTKITEKLRKDKYELQENH